MEDERVVKLIEALDRAHECRERSTVDAVCHRCWADVDVALEAVRKCISLNDLRGPHDRVRIHPRPP